MIEKFTGVRPMAFVHTAYVGFNGPNAGTIFNRNLLLDLLTDSSLDGWTVTFTEGRYQGTNEPGATVVVITETLDGRDPLLQVCDSYKLIAEQEAVWVTTREEALTVV